MLYPEKNTHLWLLGPYINWPNVLLEPVLRTLRRWLSQWSAYFASMKIWVWITNTHIKFWALLWLSLISVPRRGWQLCSWSLMALQPSQITELQIKWEILSQKLRWTMIKLDTRLVLWSQLTRTHASAYIYADTCMNTHTHTLSTLKLLSVYKWPPSKSVTLYKVL